MLFAVAGRQSLFEGRAGEGKESKKFATGGYSIENLLAMAERWREREEDDMGMGDMGMGGVEVQRLTGSGPQSLPFISAIHL
jgi:hypothetical protein